MKRETGSPHAMNATCGAGIGKCYDDDYGQTVGSEPAHAAMLASKMLTIVRRLPTRTLLGSRNEESADVHVIFINKCLACPDRGHNSQR